MSVVPDAVYNAVQLSYKYTILELLTYQLVWSRFGHIYNVDIDRIAGLDVSSIR